MTLSELTTSERIGLVLIIAIAAHLAVYGIRYLGHQLMTTESLLRWKRSVKSPGLSVLSARGNTAGTDRGVTSMVTISSCRAGYRAVARLLPETSKPPALVLAATVTQVRKSQQSRC